MKQTVRVVVRLRGRSVLARLDQARFVVTKMTGNTNFPTLATQVTGLGSAADALESAITAANTGDHEAVGLKELAAVDVDDRMAKLCDSINGVAAGDREKLLTCGLPLRRDNTPIGELAPPDDLASRLTTTTQRVALEWKGPVGARTFNVYMSTNSAPFQWELIATTTKQKHNVDDLVSGNFYWFAVSAVGAAGESSMSKPEQAMAS